MKCIKITPSLLKGSINIPPSKSLSHRAIICASFSKGKSYIKNVILSNDIIATLKAMKSFGIEIKNSKIDFDEIHNIYIEGREKLKLLNDKIDCNESGSTLRFLIPIAGLLDKKITYTGKGKLVERPLDTYYKIFKEQNISYSNNKGKLPLSIKGTLKPGIFKIKGNVSSQFITGLLFVLPLLNDNSKIILTTKLESKGYIDLTLDMLKKFSIIVENNNYREFYIKGNQKYKTNDYTVEGDFSQGAFWIIAGILSGEIECMNLNINSLQGDKTILNVVQKMGGNLSIKNSSIQVKKSNTEGTTIDASQFPDLVPILAVLGALSKGTTKIINAKRLRIKESDRLKAIATELNKLGAEVEELKDGLNIQGKDFLKGGLVHSWNDHRIAMALAIASIKCTEPVIIQNSDVVKKSYPSFWEDFKKLGGKINEWCMGK